MNRAGQGGSEARKRSLELLVPEGGPLERHAREVAGLARALGDHHAPGGDVGGQEVSLEFEREGHTQAGAALEDLLVHHLRAVHAGRSFLFLPDARRQVQAAWEELAGLRACFEQLPGVPFPGESAMAVAARLLEGLDHLAWDAEIVLLWRARLQQLDPATRAGEDVFRSALAETPAAGPGSRTYAELVLGLAECLLDRGGVREARELLREELRVHSRANQSRWLRLRRWVAVLLGDVLDASAGQGESSAQELPRALAELRVDWPAALGALAGREVPASNSRREQSTYAADSEEITRHSLGAVVFAVFTLERSGRVTALHVEVAPALRASLDGWLRDREDACSERAASEHRMVLRAEPQRAHGPRLTSCLSPGSMALALTPLLDRDGEVVGWVHLEWEHHLIPDRARLGRIAHLWKERVGPSSQLPRVLPTEFAEHVNESPAGTWRGPSARERLASVLEEPARSMTVVLLESCLATLRIKLTQRRWWAFVSEGEETRFVTSGGESLSDAGTHPGGARGLGRCRTTSGAVHFGAPEPGLSVHAASASGVVLPFVVHGQVVGMLALESTRKNDFRSVEVERLMSVVGQFALALKLVGLRAWHLKSFGSDLFFDCSQASLRDHERQMNDAARASSVVTLSGPAGSGKRMLSRWLHWSRGRSGEPYRLLHGGCDFDSESTPEQLIARLQVQSGSVVLDGLSALSPRLQAELLGQLESCGEGRGSDWRERLVVMTTGSLAEEAEHGRLLPELAARLERLQLFLPSLAARRIELPGLIQFLASRFAAEEGSGVTRFDDGGLALLWRQEWKGNIRELEALVFKLALLHPGEEIGPDEIRAVARRFRFPILDKIPSRRPARRDLVQALRTTLNNTGSMNKRRAALYLGWDPSTLLARLEEHGIDGASLKSEPEGWGI